MRFVKLIYIVVGVALFGVVVAGTDLAGAALRVGQIGWGMAVVLALYLGTFTIDSVTWLMTLGARPLTPLWAWRLWKVRLVGEAFNMTMPAGGFGGEPVKLVLLKGQYDVGYREGAASLFLGKTVNMIGLALFLAAGLVFMLRHGALPGAYTVVAGIGLAAFAAATLIFFCIQRFRLSSALTRLLGRWKLTAGLTGMLDDIHQVENRFVGFYSGARRRFAVTVAMGFLGWVIGVFEIYYALEFLGHPVSVAEAWIIEAMAQMMRAGSFFIPASIGVQDGAFVLICAAITGSPELGVAVALVRRMREIVWIIAGFAFGSLFHLSRRQMTDGADGGVDDDGNRPGAG